MHEPLILVQIFWYSALTYTSNKNSIPVVTDLVF
jgi:hypothetical protein